MKNVRQVFKAMCSKLQAKPEKGVATREVGSGTWLAHFTESLPAAQFLGLYSYYRRFIQEFASITRLLHKLTDISIIRTSEWTYDCE